MTFLAGMLCGIGVCLIAALWLVGGVAIQIYDSDPNRRMNELLNHSEDFRKIEYEWERIWFEDKAKRGGGKPEQPK